MNRRGLMQAAGVGVLGLWARGAPAAQGRPPNIVFVLADDIGYGDLGCYGATRAKTPGIDRLAAEGVRFTDAHSPSAMCTPTRYAFLTGQYAWRHPPVARGVLSGMAPLAIKPGTTTTASLLRRAGYTTGVVGKWHLGLGDPAPDYNTDVKPGPLEIGFDYAFIYPATGDRVPCVYVENHRVVGLDPKDPIRVSYGAPVGDEPTGRTSPELLKMKLSHGHDNTIINGISRIGYMAGGKAARWNDEEMADVLTSKGVAFIEQNKDRPFFLYFATHDIHVPRVPHPRFRGTSQCGLRGDVIQEFDWSVGALAQALDRLGLAENTLILVTSDNGGVMDDGYSDGAVADANGHACNGVLRGFKGGLYEGGHRVPLVARWPGRIKAAATSDALICHVDMLATFAAVAGCDLPADAGSDSLNVLPSLLGEKTGKPPREHLVMHSGGGALAVRKGPWKLIGGGPGAPAAEDTGKAKAGKAGKGGPAPGELYNLADDLKETTNLAAKYPEAVTELASLLQGFRQTGRTRP